MNLLKLFYPKSSMKRKILDIKEDIKRLVSKNCNENFWIDWYGSYEINSSNLAFWICVKSDRMKLDLKSNTDLINKLRNLLIKHNYPEQARQFVSIDFESQETVDREADGNWYHHFK